MEDVKPNVKKNQLYFQMVLAYLSIYGTEATANDNAREFGAVCKLIKVVDEGRGQPKGPGVVAEQENKRLRQLEATLQSIEAVLSPGTENVSGILQANSQDSLVKIKELNRTTLAGATQEHFKIMKTNAEKLIKTIGEKLKEETSESGKLKKELNKALFGGEDLDTPTQGISFHTTATNACGNNGQAWQKGYAGSSLAGDLFCLCASSGGSGNECKHGLQVQTGSLQAAFSSHWATTLTDCKRFTTPTFSASALRGALEHVRRLIGRHAGNSQQDRGRFVLGKGPGSQSMACGGGTNVCVNYAAAASDDSEMIEIKWATAVEAAAQILDDEKARQHTIEKGLADLEQLVREALMLYSFQEFHQSNNENTHSPASTRVHQDKLDSALNPKADNSVKDTLQNSAYAMRFASWKMLFYTLSLV